MHMIKKYWIYAFFIFAVVLFAYKRLVKQEQAVAGIVTVKTFHTGMGWGYDVLKDDAVYIHQEYMPAIEGRKGFATEADAKKIGNLVVERMKARAFPVITVEDLDRAPVLR